MEEFGRGVLKIFSLEFEVLGKWGRKNIAAVIKSTLFAVSN